MLNANQQLVLPDTPPTHQTVPELLTDKLTTIFTGETPSDKDHMSWCDNGQDNQQAAVGGSAPRGYWSSVSGQVDVDVSDVGYRDVVLGSRPPVG